MGLAQHFSRSEAVRCRQLPIHLIALIVQPEEGNKREALGRWRRDHLNKTEIQRFVVRIGNDVPGHLGSAENSASVSFNILYVLQVPRKRPRGAE